MLSNRKSVYKILMTCEVCYAGWIRVTLNDYPVNDSSGWIVSFGCFES